MRGKPLDTKKVDLPKSTMFDCHIPGQYEVIVESRWVGWVRKNRYPPRGGITTTRIACLSRGVRRRRI